MNPKLLLGVGVYVQCSGRLSKMENVSVPRGICITTNFFDQFMDEELHKCLQKLKESFSTLNHKEMERSCLEVQKKIMRQFSR